MGKFLSKYKQTGNKVSCRKDMIWLCSNLKDMQSNTLACVCIHIKNICIHFISYVVVQFSVMSYSVRPHGLQHARLPCPSPTPEAYSNSCPLHRCAIQPSHPLSSPSPPAFNLSQHQGLFQWVSSSHQVAKVLDFQHQSFQWIFKVDILSVQFSRSVMSDSCDPHGQ